MTKTHVVCRHCPTNQTVDLLTDYPHEYEHSPLVPAGWASVSVGVFDGADNVNGRDDVLLCPKCLKSLDDFLKPWTTW